MDHFVTSNERSGVVMGSVEENRIGSLSPFISFSGKFQRLEMIDEMVKRF